jgi:UDP:flavonoid glycosyltransferase YjiC (YdhE family)
MRITFLASGSRGDVQPYIAFGLGLQRAGHSVQVAAGLNYESFIREYGLGFQPMGGDFRSLMDAEGMRRVLEKSSVLNYWRDFSSSVRAEFGHFAQDAWEACRGSDAIVFSSLAVWGYSIAEKIGVPSLWAPLQPMNRTREFPSFLLSLQAGPWLNSFSHVFEEQIIWQSFREIANRWRRDTLGLKPFPFIGPYGILDRQHYPIVYGYSPTVLPKPRDWDDWIHVAGYWFLDHPTGWEPPAALVDFLASGPPPIYIGFGSMSNRRPEEVTRLVIDALALAKQRGVIATGWGGLEETRLPETIFKIDSIPHDWLFPQMSAVVHHGGGGTTAAGLRAGVPSIIVPFTVDQPFWAQRVYALGAGVKPIPRKQLTAERLAAAITQAVEDQELRTRAAALGECIRAEKGIDRAVEVFGKHVAAGAL